MAILDIYMKSENFIQDDPKTQESLNKNKDHDI
jgi:hypothetical protein